MDRAKAEISSARVAMTPHSTDADRPSHSDK